MVKKRSDYRKQHSKIKAKNFLKHVKESFSDNENVVDVNPDFKKDLNDQHFMEQSDQKSNYLENDSENKGLRLKKRLNISIIIVGVLIVIVLFILFNL